MNCRVFYHDKCFDGACSASLFTRFHRECIGTANAFEYQGLVHRAGSLYDESWFEKADENAIALHREPAVICRDSRGCGANMRKNRFLREV